MKVVIVGTGHVGLVSGACFAQVGHSVICIDSDGDKIRLLNNGELHIFEPGLDELVQSNRAVGRLSFTCDYSPAVTEADAVFLAVGTPAQADGASDLSYIRTAAAAVGGALGAHYTVVATMSTVPVGTGDEIEQIISGCSEEEGALFDVVSNPEFLREGSAVEDRLHPTRVLIGTEAPRAADLLSRLYEPFEAKVYMTNRATAELAKYACNAFLATKISFVNEIATICEAVDANIDDIVKVMGDDQRIGPHFLHAGLGYGGSCFPKDTRALDQIAHAQGHNFALLKAVITVNNMQRQRLLAKVLSELAPLTGKKIAVLGLAFKPETDDIRESPALDIIRWLLDEGAVVAAHDPVAGSKAVALLGGIVVTDVAVALKDADAMIVVTDWDEYKQLDVDTVKSLMRRPVVFDGRNIFDPDPLTAAGFTYYGVGRGHSAAHATTTG